MAPIPERVNVASHASHSYQAFPRGKEMLPAIGARIDSPEVAAPAGRGVGRRVLILFICRREVEPSIVRRDDLGVDLDLSFAVPAQASRHELVDHAAAVLPGIHVRVVAHEVRTHSRICGRHTNPDAPVVIPTGRAPHAGCVGKGRHFEFTDYWGLEWMVRQWKIAASRLCLVPARREIGHVASEMGANQIDHRRKSAQ